MTRDRRLSRQHDDRDRSGATSRDSEGLRAPGQVVGDRYRLREELGRGGTASVWRAWDTLLGRAVAVKILDPAWRTNRVAVERLSREARSVARLEHQNIVRVYDFDVDGEVAYMAMELVVGYSLADLLEVAGRLPVERAVAVAGQICDALDVVHAAGIVHRDIKPANILVDQTGTVKVCDFGIALGRKILGQAAITGADAVVGTCQFMAPEQATGRRVDARTDLYALGCVLYAMLTGAPPFRADDPMDVFHLHLHEPPVPLRAYQDDIPPDLDRLVRELLAKQRGDRPAVAWLVSDRLRAIGAGLAATPTAGPGTTPPAPQPVTPVTPVRQVEPVEPATPAFVRGRTPWWVAVPVVGVVAITVLVVAALVGGGQPHTTAGRPPPPLTVLPSHAGTPTPAEPTHLPGPTHPTVPAPSARVTTAPPQAVSPLDRIGGLAVVLRQQADAGELESKAARELYRRLADIARRLGAGDTAKAAERFGEFRDRLAELRRDGGISAAGDDALPDLHQLAESLGG